MKKHIYFGCIFGHHAQHVYCWQNYALIDFRAFSVIKFDAPVQCQVVEMANFQLTACVARCSCREHLTLVSFVVMVSGVRCVLAFRTRRM